MRKIKFRGFHACENGERTIRLNGKSIKGEWRYGDLIQVPGKNFYSIMGQTPAALNESVIPESIGEYVGLNDKYGREIYEGDIVKKEHAYFCEKYGVVKYGAFNCSCCDGVYGFYFESADIRYPEKYFVRGNVFENPELLELMDARREE